MVSTAAPVLIDGMEGPKAWNSTATTVRRNGQEALNQPTNHPNLSRQTSSSPAITTPVALQQLLQPSLQLLLLHQKRGQADSCSGPKL
jgi:hypothetical protein